MVTRAGNFKKGSVVSDDNSTKRAIIIDTDPGQDDAIAILLALASEELEDISVDLQD